MNRRVFLVLSAASIAGLLSYRIARPYLETQAITFIKAIIKNKLYYLNLDDVGLNQYCAAFLKNKSQSLIIKSGIAGIALQWTDDFDIVERKIGSERIHALEQELTLSYLLSTDFFDNASDESTIVKYLSFYDPQNPICRHPFARYG